MPDHQRPILDNIAPGLNFPQPNPFVPGFGEQPTYAARNGDPVGAFEAGLEGYDRMQRNVLISGPRGTGKTVLLNEMEQVARERGWTVITVHSGSRDFGADIASQATERLREIDPNATTSRVTSAGVNVMQFGANGTREVVDRYPHSGESWGSLLARLAEIASQQGGGVMVKVDEAHSFDPRDVQELSQRIQSYAGGRANFAFVAAGLPSGGDSLLSSDGATFLARAQAVQTGQVDQQAALHLIGETTLFGGRAISTDAVERAAELSQGHPYLMQLVGSEAWKQSTAHGGGRVTLENVNEGYRAAANEFMRTIHVPALRHATSEQRDFLVAMSEDNGRPTHMSGMVSRLGIAGGDHSATRDSLMQAGFIRPSQDGGVEFAAPLAREAVMKFHVGGPGAFNTPTRAQSATVAPTRGSQAMKIAARQREAVGRGIGR